MSAEGRACGEKPQLKDVDGSLKGLLHGKHQCFTCRLYLVARDLHVHDGTGK